MTRLDALIERLEEALEGSDELDAAIADVVLARAPSVFLLGSDTEIPMWLYPDGSFGSALRFTHSLDAAVTLRPKGAEYEISTLYGIAVVKMPLNGEPEQGVDKTGDVPLAFCIAALKAVRAMSVQGEQQCLTS